MITTAECIKRYGTPNEVGTYLVSIDLPYPMVYNGKPVKKMRCHKLVKDNFLAVFNELLSVYTYPEIVRLGIDKFGGCFNFRKMRGGTEYSRHSWGIAIDLDPQRNLLKETSKTARFARPDSLNIDPLDTSIGSELLDESQRSKLDEVLVICKSLIIE